MKRILLGLALLIGFAGAAQAQVTNPLISVFRIGTGGSCATTACTSATKQMCRDSATSTTGYACDTSTGFYAAVMSVETGARINLEGPHGDSYIVRDATVPSIDVYYDGVVRAQIRPTSMGPGVCPSPLNTMEMGWCFLAGRLVFRDTSGIYYPVGVQVVQ
jgi:hypothetical protein